MHRLGHRKHGDGPARSVPSEFAMWFGVLAGPLAWGVAFMVSVFLIRGDCLAPTVASRYLLLGVALVVAAAGVFLSWRNWLLMRDWRPESAGLPGSSRFLAIAGLSWSGISVLMVVGLLVTLMVLDPCAAGRMDVRL